MKVNGWKRSLSQYSMEHYEIEFFGEKQIVENHWQLRASIVFLLSMVDEFATLKT